MSIAALCDIAELNPPIPAGSVSGSPTAVTFVPMSAVSEDGLITRFEERAGDKVSGGYSSFQNGDILLARITPCMENGKAALVAGLPEAVGFGSTEFHVVRPGPDVDGKYLFYALWNPHFRAAAARNMTGSAGQKRVPASFLGRYRIRVPPLPEQRRIAAILDKADAIRRKRQETLKLVDDFLRSAFLDMFGDPVTNPKGWEVRELGDIAQLISGTTIAQEVPFSGQQGGWLVLRVADLALDGNAEGLSTSRSWTAQAGGAAQSCSEGSVIFPKRGGAISTNVKRLALRPCVLDPNLMAVSSEESMLRPLVLFHWFLLFDLTQITSGSSVPQLNKKDLAPLRVFIPPGGLQARFSVLAEGIARVSTVLRRMDGEAESVRGSLVQRAFRGEL